MHERSGGVSGPGRPRPARDRILQAAAKLFYADGIAATGIDAITAEAGVAKMSLYNNFASKDELVGAYIDARHKEWLELYRARAAAAATPRRRVLAVFAAYEDHAEAAYERGFRGCGLLNAAAELPVDTAGRQAVREHKEQVERMLREHLEAAGCSDAEGIAEQLSYLLEGAMSRAGLEGEPARIGRVRAMAEAVLDTV